MAMTPTQEAEYALDYEAGRAGLSPAAQIEYDRLLPAWQARHEEQAREQAKRREESRKVAAGTTWLPNLGVAVYGGNVYQHGANQSGSKSDRLVWMERSRGARMRLLGSLPGAHAEVISGKAGNRRSGGARTADAMLAAHLLGPVGLLAAMSRAGTGVAVVTFADANFWQKTFADKQSLTKAHAEAVRFNALAASSQPADLIARQIRVMEEAGHGIAHEGVCPKCSLPVTWDGSTKVPYVHAATGQYDCPPDDPSIVTGRCPKCSRPVVWYTERDKTPVHAATGKFECPPDAESQEGTGVAAQLDSQEGTGVAAELERLAALHESGALDDEEFRAAKARIIHGR